MSDEKADLQQPATLQVSGDAEVKLDSPSGEKEPSVHDEPDPMPEDRDPNNMNEYVKVCRTFQLQPPAPKANIVTYCAACRSFVSSSCFQIKARS